MSAPPPDDFTDLLVAYDEALATGRAAAFRQAVAVESDLAPRLADAQQCLDLLALVWPGPLPTAFGVAGQTVARFIIERELGRGGFGIVYLAHDPLLRHSVALKVPRLEGVGDAEQQRRFLQEARIAAGLAHPHIVPVYEAGEAGAVCYIASAYCPGQNLAEWLAGRAEPVPVKQAAELVATLADALAYCHARGVLHRDLKPSNVLLDEHLFPRITDFGLSKLLEASLTETRTSVILGTPLYMAPEQAGGQPSAVGPHGLRITDCPASW